MRIGVELYLLHRRKALTMNISYIGATDFVTREQVERARAAITVPGRVLHVGVMTSYKVLNGLPSKWADMWLKPHQIQELFQDDGSYNVIHYADYGHTAEDRAPTTVLDLVKAWDMCGAHVHAIQLDMVWPAESLIEEFLFMRPQADVILQVSSTAIDEVGAEWLDYINHYDNLARYILLDTGMGRGIEFDPAQGLSRVRQVLNGTYFFQQEQIAVAGGLGPNTYSNLKPILDTYPAISCDAQGKLRPSGNAMDPLDIELTEQYIRGVCSLLTEG